MATRITHEILIQLVSYDPLTGIFTRNGKVIGSSDCTKGYLRAMINKRLYRLHQLAWFYVYKEWPTGQIDHINRIKTDNSIANLRLADNSINMHNREAKGFRKSPGASTWNSRITINKKQIHLGCFKTEEEARNAYLIAKENYWKTQKNI